MRRDWQVTGIASTNPSCWSTSAKGSPAVPTKREQVALGAHLMRCDQDRGRLLAACMLGDAIHGFFAARFVSLTALILAASALTGWLV